MFKQLLYIERLSGVIASIDTVMCTFVIRTRIVRRGASFVIRLIRSDSNRKEGRKFEI